MSNTTKTSQIKQSNKSLAIEIADRLKKKYSIKKSDVSALIECFHTFNEDHSSTSEEFSDAEGLCIEMACLLTDPQISGRLNEAYFRSSASKILHRMVTIFRTLSGDKQMQMYIMWYSLKHFSATVSDEILSDIKHRFLKEE
ncbi:hypothetical protein [Parafilimonas terrae]|uniref:Uncharacterized protein n=1 Tax=Parafilimonas terrae TaxID=1465490 RepID=A0A1I5UD68_9BACT|nr:hypothetical protein [Parafilimonas terrae]SFP92596.1 hypothetical protein SAMN05444277_103185 [Parafilimonas terrae]